MARKKQKFDLKKEIRKLARERVGTVRPERAIPAKAEREIKHKKALELDVDKID